MLRIIPLLLTASAACFVGCASNPPPKSSTAIAPVQPEAQITRDKPRVEPTSPVWSNTATAPIGPDALIAHGKFRAEPVTVTQAKLPEHTWVKVKFRLHMLGSWDGSNVAWGPDLWSLRVRGGEQLYMTSFSNLGARTACYIQAFPDDYPWAVHHAFTGATPLSGKPFAEPDEKTFAAIADATYPIEVNFPHRGDTLTLDFQSIYNDPATDSQCWAVSDLEILPLTAPAALDDDALEKLWDELAAPSSAQANTALWELVAGGDRAAAFLIDKACRHPHASAELGNQPEGLRLYRAQKALRILGTKESRAAGDDLTYKVPAYQHESPQVSE